MKRAREWLSTSADDLVAFAGLVAASVGVEFGHPGLIVFGAGLVVVVILGARH